MRASKHHLEHHDRLLASMTDWQIDQHIAATSKYSYVLTSEERRADLQRQRDEARERLGLPCLPSERTAHGYEESS